MMSNGIIQVGFEFSWVFGCLREGHVVVVFLDLRVLLYRSFLLGGF